MLLTNLLFLLAFGGEFTIFAGLEDCLQFVANYKFSETDIEYIRKVLPNYIEQEFYDYLSKIDMNGVRLYAVPEGKTI